MCSDSKHLAPKFAADEVPSTREPLSERRKTEPRTPSGVSWNGAQIMNWDATFTIDVTEPNPNDSSDTDYIVEILVPIDDAALVDRFKLLNSGSLRCRAAMAQD